MAAKKAPMRKTMAKPATRKTAPKNTSSAVRKANAAKKARPTSAAAFRKAEEASKKKMKAKSKGVELSYTIEKDIKGAKKAGLDARGRASKYGKPVSETYVIARPGGPRKREIEASTTVRSSRGNYYTVYEDKNQRRFRPDSGRKTTTVPTDKYGNERTRESYLSKYSSKPKGKKK